MLNTCIAPMYSYLNINKNRTNRLKRLEIGYKNNTTVMHRIDYYNDVIYSEKYKQMHQVITNKIIRQNDSFRY